MMIAVILVAMAVAILIATITIRKRYPRRTQIADLILVLRAISIADRTQIPIPKRVLTRDQRRALRFLQRQIREMEPTQKQDTIQRMILILTMMRDRETARGHALN